MDTEDHRLLLEALAFFSSGDDHDDCYGSSSCSSGFDSGDDMSPAGPSLSDVLEDEDDVMDATLQQVLLGLADSDHPIQYGTPTSATRSTPSTSIMSPPSKLPLRRKRVKKCTYAARRHEVARLRSCTAQLEAQLQQLQKRIGRSDACRQRAQDEQSLLAQSRAENERLRALVTANKARLHEAQTGQQQRRHRPRVTYGDE